VDQTDFFRLTVKYLLILELCFGTLCDILETLCDILISVTKILTRATFHPSPPDF